MATPAQLMQILSDTTGLPLATIVDLDRKLVKAGLRTKGGRGFSAAQMKPIDAARLLTAILVSPQSNEAAPSVERYEQTRVNKQRSSEMLFAATGLDPLVALPARHSFVDALAALIDAAAGGALAGAQTEMDNPTEALVEVFAFTRATRGHIRIAGLPNQRTASVEYVSSLRAKDHAEKGDLEQSRRITTRTLLAVAELLGRESPHDRG